MATSYSCYTLISQENVKKRKTWIICTKLILFRDYCNVISDYICHQIYNYTYAYNNEDHHDAHESNTSTIQTYLPFKLPKLNRCPHQDGLQPTLHCLYNSRDPIKTTGSTIFLPVFNHKESVQKNYQLFSLQKETKIGWCDCPLLESYRKWTPVYSGLK